MKGLPTRPIVVPAIGVIAAYRDDSRAEQLQTSEDAQHPDSTGRRQRQQHIDLEQSRLWPSQQHLDVQSDNSRLEQ